MKNYMGKTENGKFFNLDESDLENSSFDAYVISVAIHDLSVEEPDDGGFMEKFVFKTNQKLGKPIVTVGSSRIETYLEFLEHTKEMRTIEVADEDPNALLRKARNFVRDAYYLVPEDCQHRVVDKMQEATSLIYQMGGLIKEIQCEKRESEEETC